MKLNIFINKSDFCDSSVLGLMRRSQKMINASYSVHHYDRLQRIKRQRAKLFEEK